MSNEARVVFWPLSCAWSNRAVSLGASRSVGVVAPESVPDLFSKSDLREETGLCERRVNIVLSKHLGSTDY